MCKLQTVGLFGFADGYFYGNVQVEIKNDSESSKRNSQIQDKRFFTHKGILS